MRFIVRADPLENGNWEFRMLNVKKTYDYLQAHPGAAEYEAQFDKDGVVNGVSLVGPTDNLRSFFARSLPDIYEEPETIVRAPGASG